MPHELLPNTRSELALPLEMGKLLLGVLDMESTRPGAFNENDVPFLHLLADQAASALHNARLYKQVNLFNQDLEKLVQQRTETLERMDQAKSDFISVTSHELRTPLTLLRGYGQMLSEERTIKDSSPLTTMVNGILAGADRLHAIIDSMLDVAKIENRVLELTYTTFSLQALVRLVSEDLRTALTERHLTVEEDLKDLPHLEADLDSMRKMFTELVGNAVKYTPDGGRITITGRMLPTGEVLAEDSVEVVISDTGVGIEPQIQELIFAKFYRTGPIATYSSSKTRFMGGGPGLGLSIAKGIAEAHGGIIWAESPGYDEQLCPGSQFHVILPLHKLPKNEAAAQ
jgi:signal transduction histidine kinase